jgi:hypothetical protein
MDSSRVDKTGVSAPDSAEEMGTSHSDSDSNDLARGDPDEEEAVVDWDDGEEEESGEEKVPREEGEEEEEEGEEEEEEGEEEGRGERVTRLPQHRPWQEDPPPP